MIWWRSNSKIGKLQQQKKSIENCVKKNNPLIENINVVFCILYPEINSSEIKR